MAYRADIEIAVRGAQELKRLQNEISATSKLVDGLNNYLENIGSGGVVRSINNLKTVVSDAAAAFDRVALNTDEAVIAARKYVTATNELNAELRERAALLKTVNEEERKNKLASAGIRERTQYAGPIGPGPASPVGSLVGQKSPVAERVQRTIRARQDELDLQQALLRLEQKSAAELNKKVQSQEVFIQGTKEVVALLDQQAQRQKFLAGASGTVMQGPLAGPGAMGFPVALPLTRAEQKALEAETRRQQILERMAATRQQLNGLAANLQRLEQNSAVAIADAERAQIRLNAAKTRELQLLQETAAIRNREALSSTAARQRLADDAARRRLIQDAGFGVQGPALPPTARGAAAGGRGRGRLGDIAGNAIIGGAFPLLFGQSGGAAAGGAIGGLVGGAFGGVGGFAGSLIGTVIGDIAAKGDKVRQLAEDIGFSAEQTKLLEQSFKQAGREFDNFEASVQAIRGVGLAINDQASAIQAASQLAETYGGKIDKITSAFAAALSSGKVTQATLNQLTKQGIPIQEKLAATYGVSRSQLLTMAKDGEISVQQLSNAFVSLANEASTGASAIPSAYETASRQIQQSVNELVSRVSAAFNVQTDNMATAFDNAVSRIANAISQIIARLTPLIEKVATVTGFFVDLGLKATEALLSIPNFIEAVSTSLLNVIPGLGQMLVLLEGIQQITGGGKGAKTAADYGRYAPGFMQQAVPKPIPRITAPSQAAAAGGTGGKGAKGPEDRTKSLLADLEAITKIAATENLVRDLMFEGRDINAAEVEIASKLYDIERDRIKALEAANFESEKDVINKIAAARAQAAQLELEDKIRDITSQRFAEELNAQQAVRDSVKVFTDMRKEQELQAQYGKTYLRLVTEGMLPAEAERIANFEKLAAQQLSTVAAQISITEAAIEEAKQRNAITVDLERQLKLLKQQQAAIKGEVAQGAGAGPTDAERLQEAIAATQANLNNLIDKVNVLKTGAQAFGDALSGAATGAVEALTGLDTLQERTALKSQIEQLEQLRKGAKKNSDEFSEYSKRIADAKARLTELGDVGGRVRQVFVTMLKSIGDAFMDMAKQIAAEAVKLAALKFVQFILQSLAGAAGGGGSGLGGGVSGVQTNAPGVSGLATTSMAMAANGAYWPGGFQAFADGGIVTRPTMGLIGEGGEPEYVIPASKMRSAMGRYAAGARGSSVIPSTGADGGTGQPGGIATSPIDVRYTVERINSVDYVTADQFQAGMQQAAAQGAQRGEQRALRSLQQSTSVRSKVGLR